MKFKGYSYQSKRSIGSRLAYLRRNGYISQEQFDFACNRMDEKQLINNTNTKIVRDFYCSNDAMDFINELELQYKYVFFINKTGNSFKHKEGKKETYTFEVRNSEY